MPGTGQLMFYHAADTSRLLDGRWQLVSPVHAHVLSGRALSLSPLQG